ncbi:MAG TPA: hypothetical protein PLK37_12820, partial [Terricaulis sp.]|nr:hypothetical protein [Terricaulis sp.]
MRKVLVRLLKHALVLRPTPANLGCLDLLVAFTRSAPVCVNGNMGSRQRCEQSSALLAILCIGEKSPVARIPLWMVRLENGAVAAHRP